ncbi:MAG: protein-L-isoaspartate(D-aspartate) O-methyltransferase [Candidatus Goldiibacteriota bacterium]
MMSEQMIEEQIKARGVRDPLVLEAVRKVDRRRFVPDEFKDDAYEDCPLPIGWGQTISQPYIVALMTELMGLKGGEKVLEIGAGSGYQAAVLGEICTEVYTIEITKPLAERSAALLKELGYDNVRLKAGDGFEGWPEQAPFDAIIVAAAPKEIPQPLIEQLADGGRMVIPVGSFRQELMVIEKKHGRVTKQNIIPVRFVPMTGKIEE